MLMVLVSVQVLLSHSPPVPWNRVAVAQPNPGQPAHRAWNPELSVQVALAPGVIMLFFSLSLCLCHSLSLTYKVPLPSQIRKLLLLSFFFYFFSTKATESAQSQSAGLSLVRARAHDEGTLLAPPLFSLCFAARFFPLLSELSLPLDFLFFILFLPFSRALFPVSRSPFFES